MLRLIKETLKEEPCMPTKSLLFTTDDWILFINRPVWLFMFTLPAPLGQHVTPRKYASDENAYSTIQASNDFKFKYSKWSMLDDHFYMERYKPDSQFWSAYYLLQIRQINFLLCVLFIVPLIFFFKKKSLLLVNLYVSYHEIFKRSLKFKISIYVKKVICANQVSSVTNIWYLE